MSQVLDDKVFRCDLSEDPYSAKIILRAQSSGSLCARSFLFMGITKCARKHARQSLGKEPRILWLVAIEYARLF